MDMNEMAREEMSECCVKGRTARTWKREEHVQVGLIQADFLEEAGC